MVMGVPEGKPPRKRKKGRKCVVCGAPLSIYNPAKACYSHDRPVDDKFVTRHSTRK